MLLGFCKRGRLLLHLQMELYSYLARGEARWSRCPDDVVDGSVPGLDVVGVGVQVIVYVRWRGHELRSR